jgi:hypothetical protein
MSPTSVIALARDAGIRIDVDGDNLVLEAPVEPSADVLDLLRRHKMDLIALLTGGAPAWTPEDWQAFFDERAGIVEFDGRATRDEAEAQAYRCCVVEWLRQHPVQVQSDRCAACGSEARDGAMVVPLGTTRTARDWLHPMCWPEWNAEREAEAVTGLAQFGIHPPLSDASLQRAQPSGGSA